MLSTPAAKAQPRVASRLTPFRSQRTIAVFSANVGLRATVATLLSGGRYELAEHGDSGDLSDAVERGRSDAVLVDLRLPVVPSHDVGAALRKARRDSGLPLIGICTSDVSHTARLKAIESGLWDVIEIPTAADLLIAKLNNWLALKSSLDEVRSGMLLDVETGHYTAAGLRRRLRELASLAYRSGESLSCALFGMDKVFDGYKISPAHLESAAVDFADVLSRGTRASDVVARVELLKFVVLAPYTPARGALRLGERFTSWCVTRHVEGALPVTFSAGVSSLRGSDKLLETKPELILASAGRALTQAREAGAAQVCLAADSHID